MTETACKAKRTAAAKLLLDFQRRSEESCDPVAWNDFFTSDEFLNVAYMPDFILGLEKLIAAAPPSADIPRAAIAATYRFLPDEPPTSPELQPLYILLFGKQKCSGKNLWWIFSFISGLGIVILPLFSLLDSEPLQAQPDTAEPPVTQQEEEADRYRENSYRGSASDALLVRELLDFADEWGYEVSISQNSGADADGRRINICEISVPIFGAGDALLELEQKMADVTQEEWYDASSRTAEIRLVVSAWIMYSWNGGKAFDLSQNELFKCYEAGIIGADVCALIAEDLEAEFQGVEPVGMETIDGQPFFLAKGFIRGAAVRPEVVFLLSEDGRNLYCLPGNTDVSEFSPAEFESIPAEVHTISDTFVRVFVRDCTHDTALPSATP